MKLNEILRSLRQKKVLSIQAFCDEVGISFSAYQAYEKEEESKIQIKTLERIAKFYELSLVELLTYDTPYGLKGTGLKVIIELDGKLDTLKEWFGKLEKINKALA